MQCTISLPLCFAQPSVPAFSLACILLQPHHFNDLTARQKFGFSPNQTHSVLAYNGNTYVHTLPFLGSTLLDSIFIFRSFVLFRNPPPIPLLSGAAFCDFWPSPSVSLSSISIFVLIPGVMDIRFAMCLFDTVLLSTCLISFTFTLPFFPFFSVLLLTPSSSWSCVITSFSLLSIFFAGCIPAD